MEDCCLKNLFLEYCGRLPQEIGRLTPAGSNREYWRLSSDGSSVIGVHGTSADENTAFLTICRHLHSAGIPVPEIYAVSDDGMYYLLQDLGDATLFDVLGECRKTGTYDSALGILEETLETLPAIQFKGADGLDFSVCYPVPEFDRRSIFWDLNYFKYCFLRPSGTEFDEGRLEDEFGRMADVLLEGAPFATFMYRDFQSRNIMVKDGKPWFIDFQGGRRGPLEYDVVSFLWQAKASYPARLREHLTDVYLKALSNYTEADPDRFRLRLEHFALFRTLQVLGAYGYRGNFERKSHFLESIPAALDNLRGLLEKGTGKDEYPYLREVLGEMAGKYGTEVTDKTQTGRLTVRVKSFSYRKGIPEDYSGNGGGFVFDCRSMHNPGLYNEYKPLDGRSCEVIGFLDRMGEIGKYMDSVYRLVDSAVNKYLERGFTNLAVNFGCTGGRHRSVRCAELMAAHLKERYGEAIDVRLAHRELDR